MEDISTIQAKGHSNDTSNSDRSSESSHTSDASHASSHSTINETMNLDNFLEYLTRHRKSESSDGSSL